MTSTHVRAISSLLLASAVLLALTSCFSPPQPVPTVTAVAPKPTPTPTPTVSSLDMTAPSPLINLNCSDFVTTAQLHAAFGNAAVALVQASAMAAGDVQLVASEQPTADFVRASGGVDCLWTNKPTNYYSTTFDHSLRALEISVLFNAAGPWSKLESVDGTTGDLNDGSCDIGVCQLSQLVNGTTWTDMTEWNQNPSSDPFGSIINQVKAAAVAGGTAPIAPPLANGTLALGTQCSDFVPDADVKQALGSATPVVSSTPLGLTDSLDFYSVWSGAQDELHDHPCVWKRGSQTVGTLSWIPGGAWAWSEAQALPMIDGPAQKLAVQGLPNGDDAWIRCAAADASCIVDLIVGGNWIETSLPAAGTVDKRTAITAIATSIVTTLG